MMDSLARALALKFIKGKADLVDGKVPSDQLPSYVSNIVEVETYADLPAQGETDTIYIVKTPAVTTYRWTGSTYIVIDEKAQYYSVKVSSTNIITMGDLRNYINNVNSTGLHCLFDFSDFISNAYVCTVLCFTQTNVNYCVIFDIINGRTYVDYAGYQDNETVQSYVNRLGDNIPRVISITDANTTVQDIIDLLNDVNVIGHHILFDFHAIQAGCYLCTMTYTSNNAIITDIVGCRVAKATFDNATLLSTVLGGMGELVDTKSNQTIGSLKIFENGIEVANVNSSYVKLLIYTSQYYNTLSRGGNDKIRIGGTQIEFANRIVPFSNGGADLGTSSVKWGNLYLSGDIDFSGVVSIAGTARYQFTAWNILPYGNQTLGSSSYKFGGLYLTDTATITDGTNSVTVADIAKKDEAFPILPAPDPTSLTNYELSLLLKGCKIDGEFLGLQDPLVLPSGVVGATPDNRFAILFGHTNNQYTTVCSLANIDTVNKRASLSGGGQAYYLNFDFGMIRFLRGLDLGQSDSAVSIKGKAIPDYPTTNTNKQVPTIQPNGGTIIWEDKADPEGTPNHFSSLTSPLDANTIAIITNGKPTIVDSYGSYKNIVLMPPATPLADEYVGYCFAISTTASWYAQLRCYRIRANGSFAISTKALLSSDVGDFEFDSLTKINGTNVSDIINGTPNVIKVSEMQDSTHFTQDQIDIISNGKNTIIEGLFFSRDVNFLFGVTSSGTNLSGMRYSGYYGDTRLDMITINLSTRQVTVSGNLRLDKIYDINGKSLNYYLNNVYPYASNSTTELKYETINNISISTDTTFTLQSAPSSTYPEYKANITNTDTSNAITITLPVGTIIKGNVTISSNTFEIAADSSVELNIQNGHAIVVDWSI